MTIEDFFTLTEMKDGFTTPARVEELITVMQKEKDSLVKSVGDATRQWAAVASTIAATENKECLDLFIQLDGLWFIDRWLKDAQTFPDEASDCFVEEAISALLQAIEKLQVNGEKLASSGICITVKSLLSYKSARVQDKARALYDSWKAKDVDCKSMDVELTPGYSDPELDNQKPDSILPANGPSPTRSSGGEKLEGTERGENASIDQAGSQVTSNHTNCNDGCPVMVASPAKMESVEGDPVKVEVSQCAGILVSKCVTDPEQGTDSTSYKSLKPEPLSEEAKVEDKFDKLPDTSGIKDTSTSGVSDSKDVSPRIDAEAAEEAVANSNMGEYDAKDESPVKTASASDTNSPVGESSNEVDDSDSNGLEPGDDSVLEDSKDQGATFSRLEDDDAHNEVKRYRSDRRYLGNSCEFASLTKNGKATDIIRQTRDMDLEDGTVDALEVARLVAKEVEREVGGYDEQSGSSTSSSSSSSDRKSRGGIRQLDSPMSVNGEKDLLVDGPMKQLSTEIAPDASRKAPLIVSADLKTNPKNHVQDIESSLVTEAVREPENNTEKSFWEFDLNQEFSSEDADHLVGTASSNPVSAVSASRGVVASGIPAGPLHFVGSLGWKGSAATSAFRPASPRRASESDRALSGGGTSSGSRHRQDFLNIDLNVAEGGDDKIVNPLLDKQKQMLPSLPSGESSVEASPKRSPRLKLDLNQTEDDEGLLSVEWKMGGQLFRPQSCHRSPSPASSSSCMQPVMRNFDLNDNPFNCNDLSDQPIFLGESSRKVNPCMGSPDDTVISILGAKVKRNTFPPQTPLPFLNGRASEPMMDASLLRGGPLMGLGPAVPYPLGFNGLAMGPAVSFASAQIYRPGGPIPYVFDSRGTPFLPQILGSPSAVPPSFGQPSLVMSMMGATPGPNHAGPFRPNLDLNSGFANSVEPGNPDPAFFRPLFIPLGQGRPSEEQLSLRDSFRPLSSGDGVGKRKEPDSGWDFYPTNYKHQQPPHL